MTDIDPIVKDFCMNIKRLRKDQKLSLDELAKRSSLAKSYIWELEHFRVPTPSIVTLYLLCEGLACTPAELLGEIDEPLLHPIAMRLANDVHQELMKSRNEE